MEAQSLVVRYAESADSEESSGELLVDSNQLADQFVYVDVIYRLRSDSPGRVSFQCGNFSHSGRLLTGGRRSHSLRVPASELSVHGAIAFRATEPLDIERALLREDFYDFFGLLSGRWNNHAARDRDQEAARLGDSLALHVGLYMTWQCDYRCSYCWQEFPSHLFRDGASPERAPEIWAEALNRLGPYLIHVTGGEPCLYKPLPRLITLIDRSIRLSIHTNFGPSFDIGRWTAHVDPERVGELLLSFHPTRVETNEFFDKLVELLRSGWKDLSVVMPLFPANVPYCREMLRRCAELNLPGRFQPYVPPEGSPAQRDRRLIAEMQRWICEADRLAGERGWSRLTLDAYGKEQYWEIRDDTVDTATNSIPAEALTAPHNHSKGRKPVFCNAGRRRLVVEETGDAYTCMSALTRSKIFGSSALPHYARMGNVFDPAFEPHLRPIICWESFRCGGDDFQYLDSAWRPLCDTDLNLVIPE